MNETISQLQAQIDAAPGRLNLIRQHWNGTAPSAWLTSESAAALDDKLRKLGVNFPALVVESATDRMKLRGFRQRGAESVDPWLADVFGELNGDALAELVHTDRQLYGAAYVTVWADQHGQQPVLTADSAFNCAVKTDPATGARVAALRTWKDGDKEMATYYTPATVQVYTRRANTGQWQAHGPLLDNPLGAVPVVPFLRRRSLDDTTGTSAVEDILDLTAALSKVLADAMVTSEYFAKPRRWATGLEIVEDDDGNAIDPFGNGRFLQSEAPETKFGQLQGTGPSGYTDLVATLTQQIGALTGLPPHYLGLHGDQPANAEGVRAAETQLVSRVYSELRQLTGPWSEVASLLSAAAAIVEDGGPGPVLRYVAEFESPEIKTPSQAADSASKLHTIGVPLRQLLSNPLDYAPHEVESIMEEYEREQVRRIALGPGNNGI